VIDERIVTVEQQTPTPGKDPMPATSEPIRPNFSADAYAGIAPYYLRYRVPYPGRLLADMLERSGVTGGGRLLDVACGPGRLALAIAPSFREIWAVDQEPEMIEAARREAERRGVGGIEWKVGRAEELEAPPESFDLVTYGESFHRLDQRLMALKSHGWLKPGCRLAALGSYSILSGREPWQRTVVDAVLRWTSRPSRDRRGGEQKAVESGPAHCERVFREAGFLEVASHAFVEEHEWTIETILGYLYSTSVCSRNVLGGDRESFEADLGSALLALDPGGTYSEDAQWGYTSGRKPGIAGRTP
jgi:ubiquinone/menaquinone biosynthesis C-methylase UbiE